MLHCRKLFVFVCVFNARKIQCMKSSNLLFQGMTAVKMFYFHFHTGFMDIQKESFSFDRKALDGSVKKKDKFPSPFHAVVEGEWDMTAIGVYREASWQNLPYPKSTPITCFSSATEQFEVLKLMGEIYIGQNQGYEYIHPYISTCISSRIIKGWLCLGHFKTNDFFSG